VSTRTRKPHEVTFAYLKSWSTNREKKRGLWYFDIEQQKIRFATENGRFSFATKRDLYIPKINGQRNQAAEDWLAEAEGDLVCLIKRIVDGDFNRKISLKELWKVVFALVSLGYRSAPEIRKITEKILGNPQWCEYFGVTDQASAHKAVVENMVNRISERARFYMGGNIQILFQLDHPLLVCERPLSDMRELALMPLTPNAALKMEPRTASIVPELTWYKPSVGAREFCSTLNSFTLESARKWVVAQNPDLLESIRDELTLEKVRARSEMERVIFTTPNENEGASMWWEFPE